MPSEWYGTVVDYHGRASECPGQKTGYIKFEKETSQCDLPSVPCHGRGELSLLSDTPSSSMTVRGNTALPPAAGSLRSFVQFDAMPLLRVFMWGTAAEKVQPRSPVRPNHMKRSRFAKVSIFEDGLDTCSGSTGGVGAHDQFTGRILYNLFFHPLAKYPGPLLHRASVLPSLYYVWRGDRHLVISSLHEKYGDVVRTEPNFLSFNCVKAIPEIYGPHAKFGKGTFYSRGPPEKQKVQNVASTVDKVVHGRKRRIISPALSDSALRSYEPLIISQIELFCSQIADPNSFDGPYKNMSRWFTYLTYDIMGHLTFGKGYNMLTSDEHHFIHSLIDYFQRQNALLGTAPLIEKLGLAPLLFLKVMRGEAKFRQYVASQAQHRIDLEESGKSGHDIFKLLLQHVDRKTNEKMTFKELADEAVVLIIAASDTSSTVMSGLAHYLARYPDCFAKLKSEIRTTFSQVDDIRHGPLLASCSYLKACVEEALRMSPGVPGYLPRQNAEPAVVDGRVVPAGAQVGIPMWSMHRREDIFPEPCVFRPERWLGLTEEQSEKQRAAFMPFSIGPRGCVGKGMAYFTIYLTIARLVFLYDIESREPVADEFHVKDHFAAGGKQGPFLKFADRRKE
ncbi:uncharacterized protein Z518_00660 [Rhinocladiella mackenziei CBS 650.93]|uniref:Cytochrome P450 monooxygenase n=1 Tax=Rhinocladiella mackenziei CBS 650.93 TaxID=1442369 RepID=A0A0D2JJI5_9EURO|nr:uncharacterized protein Z518_00660 [Rhinocladiella mackenziei CBS 650.93]KIX09580.1 hypothetical protein Z518_00660 [Rhinocladiella mackenziei CBS 650.93]